MIIKEIQREEIFSPAGSFLRRKKQIPAGTIRFRQEYNSVTASICGCGPLQKLFFSLYA